MLIFKPLDHSYESIQKDDIDWISVTTIVSGLKEKFDANAESVKQSKKRTSKWYGKSAEEIRSIWKSEADRSTVLGNWYHNQREADLFEFNTMNSNKKNVPIVKSLENEDGYKVASSQKLSDGIYPEVLLYLNSYGICGQSDRVDIVDGVVDILDFKTNKEIKTESYQNWEGKRKMMLSPVAHLQDCHINHYALQLSIYMFIILRHNPMYKPGKLSLQHVSFEEEDYKNEYGYPIHKLVNGEPIVKEITFYDLPYLRKEVIAIMNWLPRNKDKIKKQKHD